MANAQGFSCPFCFYSVFNYSAFEQHVVRFHQHDKNFVAYCDAEGCEYSATVWNTFRKHVARVHNGDAQLRFATGLDHGDLDSADSHDGLDEAGDDASYVADTTGILPDRQRQLLSAKYAMNLDAGHNLSQAAVNSILESTEQFVNDQLNLFKIQIEKQLREKDLPTDMLSNIPLNDLFNEVSTAAKRKNVYKGSFHMIEPKPVMLGKHWVTVKGVLVEKEAYGYIIPFEENIKQLASMPEVWHYINNPHNSQSHIMRDICDGQFMAEHPFFSSHPKALQLILNTDDLELVNALGSKVKKHKLCMVYFKLGNIPPELRSNLNSIQLIGVAKSKDVRAVGPGVLLKDFIASVNKMSTSGILIDVGGTTELLKGALALVPCDTPASQWLVGMKEGVAFAEKSCRGCDGRTNFEMKTKFNLNDFKIRTDIEHQERCSQLAEFTASYRAYWSRTWGINSRSCLMDLKVFSLDMMVQDPMHVLLEGVVPKHVAYFLEYAIFTKKYFSLNWLNYRITSFSYSYLQVKSKPEKVERSHLKKGQVKQNSSGMLVLSEILPFILGLKVPETDTKLQCLLKLLYIVQICTSPVCTASTAQSLAFMIEDHHNHYVQEYGGGVITPKCHYMVHFPRQLQMFGPLRHHWLMRDEAKHSWFTTRKTRNFKNLPLTMSHKHQKYMCHVMTDSMGNKSRNFLYGGDVVGRGEQIPTPIALLVSQPDQTGSESETTYVAQNLLIHGHQYKPGCALVIDYNGDGEPVFGIVSRILVQARIKYFEVEVHETAFFDPVVLAYAISKTNQVKFIPHSKLPSRWPLSVTHYAGRCYIVNKYSHIVECLEY